MSCQFEQGAGFEPAKGFPHPISNGAGNQLSRACVFPPRRPCNVFLANPGPVQLAQMSTYAPCSKACWEQVMSAHIIIKREDLPQAGKTTIIGPPYGFV